MAFGIIQMLAAQVRQNHNQMKGDCTQVKIIVVGTQEKTPNSFKICMNSLLRNYYITKNYQKTIA